MAYARLNAVYDLTGNGPPVNAPVLTTWGQALTFLVDYKYSNGLKVPLGSTTSVLAIRGLANGIEVVQSVTGVYSVATGLYTFVLADAQYAALPIGDYYFEVWLYFGLNATCVLRRSLLTISPVVPGAPGNATPALPWLAQPAYSAGAGSTTVKTQPYNTSATIAADVGMAVCDATNGPLNMVLPATNKDKMITVKKNDLTNNTVTFTGANGAQIERAATLVLNTPGATIELTCDGVSWLIAG